MTVQFTEEIYDKLHPQKKYQLKLAEQDKAVRRIQRMTRRYHARRLFELACEKRAQNPNGKLLRRFLVNNHHMFRLSIHIHDNLQEFIIIAYSMDYYATINPLTIKIKDIDPHDFRSSLPNLGRLADMISPRVHFIFIGRCLIFLAYR